MLRFNCLSVVQQNIILHKRTAAKAPANQPTNRPTDLHQEWNMVEVLANQQNAFPLFLGMYSGCNVWRGFREISKTYAPLFTHNPMPEHWDTINAPKRRTTMKASGRKSLKIDYFWIIPSLEHNLWLFTPSFGAGRAYMRYANYETAKGVNLIISGLSFGSK